MLADNENWVLVSMYYVPPLESSGLYKDEIFQVSTDGMKKMRRLAHHRSPYVNSYYR
jgi:hypothetical protein